MTGKQSSQVQPKNIAGHHGCGFKGRQFRFQTGNAIQIQFHREEASCLGRKSAGQGAVAGADLQDEVAGTGMDPPDDAVNNSFISKKMLAKPLFRARLIGLDKLLAGSHNYSLFYRGDTSPAIKFRRILDMSGKVAEVGDQNFEVEVLNSKVPVLVDFWAAWCAPCRMLAPVVEAIAEQYEGKAKVLKLNVDENILTAGKYNIKGIPTLLLFKDGEIKEQIVGNTAKGTISKMIDNHL
jgi:thioredoxin 1